MILYRCPLPSLSANKGVNQQIMRLTPFIKQKKLHCLRKLITFFYCNIRLYL